MNEFEELSRPEDVSGMTEVVRQGSHTCSCQTNPAPLRSYVYAIGRIRPRFPRLSIEKEFAQLVGREALESPGTLGPDRQLLHSVLTKPQNKYFARQLCWVFSVEGVDTYIIVPRDPSDISLLIETLRPSPSPLDVDVVIGVKGPIAPPEVCNALMIPFVLTDQVYSFDRPALIQHVMDSLKTHTTVQKGDEESLRNSASELFERIVQITDNAGNSDQHRALNYLAVRYDRIYSLVGEEHRNDNSFASINVRPSSIAGARKVVDVLFSFTNRKTDVTSRFIVRVDVTDEFPFLVTKLAPTTEIMAS